MIFKKKLAHAHTRLKIVKMSRQRVIAEAPPLFLAPPPQFPKLIPSAPSISTMCGSSPGAVINFFALKLSIESAMTRALVLWARGRGWGNINPWSQGGGNINPWSQGGGNINPWSQGGGNINPWSQGGDTLTPLSQSGETLTPWSQGGDTLTPWSQGGDTLTP